MLNFVEIDNQPGMARDISSHAVVSTDPKKINEYNARKAIAAQQAFEIDILKNDMKEIKSMLSALLQR